MTATATISPYYQKYTDFRISRIKFWKPKIASALDEIASPILTKPTLAEAILAVQSVPPMTKLATTVQNIYTDAGRMVGAYAYQDVRKQKKAHRTQTKALLPIGYNEQLINDIIQYYQTSLFSGAVLPISQNLRDYILAKVIEAQQTGDSISDVAKAIEPYLANKALLIARTETIKAANYGAKKGAQLTGYDMNKVWVAAKDYRTRRIPRDKADHLHMNNKEAGMDELFTVGDKNGSVLMDRPGDSSAPAEQIINCRCALSFRVL